MKVWRVTRSAHSALDGAGAIAHGGRYSPPGLPVVHFASEAALAVLIALRYHATEAVPDLVLGWTEINALPERVPQGLDEDGIRAWVTDWLRERRSLVAAVVSRVLPEGDVVMFNPLHRDAALVNPLHTRPFSFAECLHTPPMRVIYGADL